MRLELNPDDLRPLVQAVVAEVVAARTDADSKLGGRLGFTEPEAAAALGIAPHCLRDCRLRREIHARKIGKRYVYSAAELRRFLEES